MTLTERLERIESIHGPVSQFVLRSKPLKPDSHLSGIGDGVYWWNGKQGFNAFGATVFYTEKAAHDFLRAIEAKTHQTNQESQQ